ncbi:MAG: hypothetical protein QXR31_01445 [Zestosphaera sp.]
MTNQITIKQTKANEEEITVLEKAKITRAELDFPLEGSYYYVSFRLSNYEFKILLERGAFYECGEQVTCVDYNIKFYEHNNLLKTLSFTIEISPTVLYAVEFIDKTVKIYEYAEINKWNEIDEFTISREIAGEVSIAIYGTDYDKIYPVIATIYYEEYTPPPPPAPTPKKVAFPWWILIILLLLIAITTRKEETQK